MSWVHLRDEARKARKRYRCSGCWEFIEIGEPHTYRTGVMDREFQSARWHPECDEFAFYDGGYEDGVTPGSFSHREALDFMAEQEKNG